MEARRRRREPLRTCVGCRRVRPKSEMTRLVARDGSIVEDPEGRAPGRGAYVCPGAECRDRARGRLVRALRARETADEGAREEKKLSAEE
ncbi:MAG: YlxR family protein [Actinomycetota bacterium]